MSENVIVNIPDHCHVRIYTWASDDGTSSIVRHAHGPDEQCTADCDYSGMGAR